MREGWKRTKLGDITQQYIDKFDVEPGSVYKNLGVKWYAEGVFSRESKLGSEIKAASLYRVREGQFIYNRMFATEGSFALVTESHAEGVVSNEFPVFDVDSSRALPEFLRLHFQQPAVWAVVAAECVGTTKSRSRWKEQRFAEYEIALPSVEEQQRVVDLIGSLDGAIEAAETAAKTALSLLHQMGLDAVRQSRDGGWDVLPLAEALGAGGTIQTGPFGSQLHKHDYVDEGIGIVMPANMRNGMVSPDGLSRVTPTDAARLKRHQLQVGDIAWSRRGDVTRFAVINEDQQGMICGTGCLLVRPDDPALTGWLSVWLSTSFVADWLVDHAVGATMANLNTKILGQVPVALPPVELRPAFVAAMNGLKAFRLSADAYSCSIRGVRAELLSVLLSGQHAIPESYDVDIAVPLEPAA